MGKVGRGNRGADLGVVHPQRDRLHGLPRSVDPGLQCRAPVHELLELVVLGVRLGVVFVVLVFVIVLPAVPTTRLAIAPPVAVTLEGAPDLVDIGEAEDELAVGLDGCFAERGGAPNVVALQAAPVQRPLGVLVLEEIHQAVRWGRAILPGEVLLQAP
jgi:hypothetical protein